MRAAEGGGIFVSYRREESSHVAGRLPDRLIERFGAEQVFIDVEAIEPGVDFAEAIFSAVDACVVLVAVIGPGWLLAADERGGRRLDDPDDLSDLAKAVAAIDPGRAARLADDAERTANATSDNSSFDNYMKSQVLIGVAVAVAVTDPGRAERIANGITNERAKAEALSGVAEAVASTDPGRRPKAEALSGIAKALAD